MTGSEETSKESQAHTGSSGEDSKEGSLTGALAQPTQASAPTALEASGTPGAAATNLAPVLATPQGAPTTPPGAPATLASALTAARHAGSFGCELSTLRGLVTENCAAGWLGSSREPLQAPILARLSADAAPLSADAVLESHPGGDTGSGTAVENRSGGSGQGPAPGGGSGASSVGGSGLAPSAFLTLAALLLLAAPHTLRRLRLSSLPWRTAFFVLIPERPG